MRIRAWDADTENGEVNQVYGDGVYPGDLQGNDSESSITTFELDPDLLTDGELEVWIDIDATHDYPYGAVSIDWSKLTVRWDWTPPGDRL